MIAAAWSHVALNCSDQHSTEEFYTRWFGFDRVRDVVLPDTKIVFLRCGGVLLELFEVGRDRAAVGHGDGLHRAGLVRHLAFQTADVDAFLQAMGTAAIVTLGPLAFDDVIPGWRSVWLRDPDGVVVEVSQGYRDETTTNTDPTDPEETA